MKEETVNLFLNFTVLSEFSYVDTAVGTEKMLLSRRKQNLFLVDLWKNRLDGKVLLFFLFFVVQAKGGWNVYLVVSSIGCNIYTSCPFPRRHFSKQKRIHEPTTLQSILTVITQDEISSFWLTLNTFQYVSTG